MDDFHLDDGTEIPVKRPVPSLAPLKKPAKLGPLQTTTPKVEAVINKLSAKPIGGKLSASNLMSRSGLMLSASSSVSGSLDVLKNDGKKEGVLRKHEKELDEINRVGEIQSADAKGRWKGIVDEERAIGMIIFNCVGEKKVAEVKQENEIEMREIVEKHETAMEKIEGDNKTAVSKSKKARDLLDAQIAENEAETALAKEKIKDLVREIQDEGEAEIQDITERNEAKARQLRASYEKKNVDLKDSLETRLDDRKKAFAKEMAELETHHKEQKGDMMTEYSSEFSETEKVKFDKARAAIDAESKKVEQLRARVAQDLEDVENQVKEIETRKRSCDMESTELTQTENDIKKRRDRMVTDQTQLSSDELNQKSRMSAKGVEESLELKRQDEELDNLRASLKQKRSTVDDERVELERELVKITDLHNTIVKEQEAIHISQQAKPVESNLPPPSNATETTMKRLDDLDNLQSDFRSKLADYMHTPTREDDYVDGENDENYDSVSIVSEIVENVNKRNVKSSLSRSRYRKNRSRSRSRGKSIERRLFDDEYSSSIESDGYIDRKLMCSNESPATRLEKKMRNEEIQLKRARATLKQERNSIEDRRMELGHTTDKFRLEMKEIARV
jgi:hypothetical protein